MSQQILVVDVNPDILAGDNVANVVDDKENIPSEELIANFRINGRSRGETGCTSPFKNNLQEK